VSRPDHFEQLRRNLARLREQLARRGSGGVQEWLTFAEALDSLLDQIEAERKQIMRRQSELEERLLAIENSRLFRALRWPGRCLLDWRGRLGQRLLNSPLHPLYLKIVKPSAAIDRYRLWLENERAPVERALIRNPRISIVLPVHEPRREWLEAAVDSVLRQTYGAWQLCVCDDASSGAWIAEYFGAKTASDPRIRFVRADNNLGIAGASNRAGELADGEYVGFLDQDDMLAPHALYCMAEAVEDGRPDLLYSDEDYLDAQDRRVQPVFKPAYSPDLLRCCMYLGHLLVVRREKLQQIGWFRPGYDGSQDYDLALRVTESGAVVRHIPRVLYHWRRHAGSTALHAAAKPFTQAAGLKALSEVVHRRNAGAVVQHGSLPNTYRVRWPAPAGWKASIVICSRNADLLAKCLAAVERRTAYPNREIIVVEHRTGDPGPMDRLLARFPGSRVSYSGPFHFAKMNNLGAKRASGDVLVFLNDDVEPLTPAWLEELVAHAARPEVGVVGAKLLYPSGAIQHAGIVIGIMDGAGHLHRDTFAALYWNWLPFTRNVSAVTGACLAMRRAVFEELGGFDESFPVNYNDVDLCLRAQQAGYQVVLEPAAVLRHEECRSRRPGVRFEERERFEHRWAVWLVRGDPFYSPYLSRTREDASLELEFPADPMPR